TVISVSGSGSQPGYVLAVLAAIESRSGFAPHVIAYWLTSAKIASAAACFSSSGAGKSGKPWARLTAPRAMASRFISRMTDSVNRSAFALIRALRAVAGACGMRPSLRGGGWRQRARVASAHRSDNFMVPEPARSIYRSAQSKEGEGRAEAIDRAQPCRGLPVRPWLDRSARRHPG